MQLARKIHFKRFCLFKWNKILALPDFYPSGSNYRFEDKTL
jgi:hypothetical protein